MPEQVPFINRENELTLIDKLIREWDTLRILCIDAPGGIGKTRLLQEIYKRYIDVDQSHLRVSEIIDFDDPACHVAESLGIKTARMLDKEIFASYLLAVQDYRKMEIADVSNKRLTQGFIEGTQSFIDCFNKFSEQKRVVIFFDTIEKLEETDYGKFILETQSKFKNSLIIMAGRNARSVGEFLQNQLSEDIVYISDLPPLNEKAGEEYLRQKQALLHIELGSELAQKLLLLSKERSILIDLAVEWKARGISLDWLVRSSLQELHSLSENEVKERSKEFERQLVIHMAQPRSQMDWLILLMSRVYPLDVEMITTLRNISEKRAEKLFEEIKKYVFVKFLPDGRITLHDEMRRMINNYIWPELDPEGYRQRRDSELAVKCLENRIQAMSRQIAQLDEKKRLAIEKKEIELELDVFGKQEALEREMWLSKQQLLDHTLSVDVHKGVQVFIELFDEATRESRLNFREMLFIPIQNYIKLFSFDQLYELNTRRMEHWRYKGHYQETKEIATNILGSPNIISEQQINMLIARGNAEIRIGHVYKGISDFEEAVKISKTCKHPSLQIKPLNELGWAYCLSGDYDLAQQYSLEARRLCLQEGGSEKKELQYDYGMISNNLAFVLSDRNATRRTAIDIAHSAIAHWQSIRNNIGLGAGYLVLGIAYYRSDLYEPALAAFQKALNIFEPLKLNDWLGQIYSWRGALYEDMDKLDDAQKDLEESLEIGASNIEAMTLNRLGRVYMYQKKLDLAEQYMKKSLKRAQEIPDYIYWLGSIARLAIIAAEKGEHNRLDEFHEMLQNCLKEIGNPEKNSLGMVYIAFAKLAFGQNDKSKTNTIIEFLKEGISLVTEFGSYARTDILSRLAFIEKDFHKINPEIIRSVGQAVKEHVNEKELEDIVYGVLIPVIRRWATWKGG